MVTTTAPSAQKDIARITLTVLAIGLLIAGSLWVLRPFAGALAWAIMIAVATWPLMLRVQAWCGGRRGLAVLVMTAVLLLVLFVPLYLAVSTLLDQTDRITQLLHELPTLRLPPPPSWIEALPLVGAKMTRRWLELSALEPEQLGERMAPYLRTALAWFAAQAGGFGATVLQFLLTVLITAIVYTKGEAGERTLRRFFRRLSGARGDEIVTLSGKAIRAVALGIVVTALVQTALAGLGLVAIGFPFAGLIAAVVLMLCIAQLGPLLALVPCVVWLYATGAPVRATVLLVITLVAQAVDNVLRPILIRRGADLSLLLIFPGVIGGLLWLGIIGLFIGPLLLAVTSTLLEGWVASGVGEHAPDGPGQAAAAGGGARPPGGDATVSA